MNNVESLGLLFSSHPRLLGEAEAMASSKKKEVGPAGVLYARQKARKELNPKKPS